MKCVVCTGTTGSERRAYLKELEYHTSKSMNMKFHILDPWLETKASHPDIDEATILNAPDEERLDYFHDSYQKIASELANQRKKQEDTFIAVPTHSVFYWKSMFKDAVKDEFIEWLCPDFFITIVHNVRTVKKNLEEDEHHRFPNVTLPEILQWRQRETEGTNRWAEKFRKPHFVIARNEPIETLRDILFADKKKIYFSYPMSHVNPEEMNKARKLIKKLRKIGYVVFDPDSIDDAKYVGELNKQLKAKKIRSTIRSKGELSQISKMIGELTVALDYKLIEQSDIVVVRYPSVEYQKYIVEEDKTTPAMYVPLSAGVICEMARGNDRQKKVYAAWLPKVEPSPFFKYQCCRLFKNEKDLLDFLQQNEPPSPTS
jgi:hypothetical protein